ncbi:MAG TPA: DUF4034 domain-containing protein [bacterium]|nr:DUF4034 domain-containing protein [bacterium]
MAGSDQQRQRWLICGLGGCALLVLIGCGAVAALLVPTFNRLQTAIDRAGMTVSARDAAADLPVNAPPLPEMHRGRELHIADAQVLRAQFAAGAYALLDADYQEQLTRRLDYDARYNLALLVQQLGDAPEAAADSFAEWKQALPQSHLPYLLQGNWHINQAWAARGGGWASTVTDSGWQGFRRQLELAEQELQQAYVRCPADPNVGATGIILAMGQGTNAERGWFARAMAADPYHTQAYRFLLNAHFPKWGGSWEESRAIVDEALGKMENNSQLFVLLPEWHEERVERELDDSSNRRTEKRTAQRRAYAEELRSAYAAAAEKYPDEYEIHMRYAFDASMNRERETAMREFEQIIPRWEQGQAVPLPGGSAQAYLNKYAWLLATSSDDRFYNPQLALVYAKKAVAMAPDWEWALDTLACAYAANGQFDKAIAAQREAQQHGNAGFQRHCENDIAVYEQHQAPRY